MQTRLLAGASTGAFAALLCNPLDLLKTRLQLRVGAHGAGGSAPQVLKVMVASEGEGRLEIKPNVGIYGHTN